MAFASSWAWPRRGSSPASSCTSRTGTRLDAGEGGRVVHAASRFLRVGTPLRGRSGGLGRDRRAQRLAVAVPHRGDPGDRRRLLRALAPRRRPRARVVARARREGVARAAPRGRGAHPPARRAPHGGRSATGPPRPRLRPPVLLHGRQRLRPVVLGRRDRRQHLRAERGRQGLRHRDPLRVRDRRPRADLAALGPHRRAQAPREPVPRGRRGGVRGQHDRRPGARDRRARRRPLLPARRAPGVLDDAGGAAQRHRGRGRDRAPSTPSGTSAASSARISSAW